MPRMSITMPSQHAISVKTKQDLNTERHAHQVKVQKTGKVRQKVRGQIECSHPGVHDVRIGTSCVARRNGLALCIEGHGRGTSLLEYDTLRFFGPIHCHTKRNVISDTYWLCVVHWNNDLTAMQGRREDGAVGDVRPGKISRKCNRDCIVAVYPVYVRIFCLR